MTTALVLMLIPVVFQLPSSTEGISCVRCGWGEEQPCGQTLPKATHCGGWDYKSCLVGVHVDEKTARVHETRRCSKTTSDGDRDHTETDGSVFGLLCRMDGCNFDRSERPPPLAVNCSLAPSQPSVTTAVAATDGGGRPPPPPPLIECIQCGWRFGEPCGAQLPPPTSCPETEHGRCFAGLVVDTNTTGVREARGCVTGFSPTPAYGHLYGNETLLGATCVTDGCNADDERRRQCDVSNSASPRSSVDVAALNVMAALMLVTHYCATAATSMGVASLV